MTFRQCREERKLTQEQLSALADVPQATISIIERGGVANPRFDTVANLARAMAMTAEQMASVIAETVATEAVS
jgi:transcriptional regulator with XRE-family HTH domain